MKKHAYIELGRAVLKTEAEAISALTERLDQGFHDACDLVLKCAGRIVVTGMGKSGHIGNKIAATLASTGSPAFFMHPGEASHGDLGMITADDLVIALSNSGETSEITLLLPWLKRIGIPLLALTGNPHPRWHAVPIFIWMSVSPGKPARWGWHPLPAPPRPWPWVTRSRWRC